MADNFAITKDEKHLVLVVLDELLRLDYSTLNRHFGTLTIKEMQDLHSKLFHEDFCKRNGISRWEDMTADDYEQEYRERWES